MKFRKLRIAWSVFWGLACVLLIVLWVRSYWRLDILDYKSARTMTRVISFRGSVGFTFANFSSPFSPEFRGSEFTTGTAQGSNVSYNDSAGNPLPSFLGFKLDWRSIPVAGTMMTTVVFPYWFPVYIAAGSAATPWLRRRFSLRTLLIATTLVAVALGMAFWTSR